MGFRPFVRLLAQQFELNGWVNNDVDGVHIELNATQQKAAFFLNHLLENPPVLATITDYSLSEIASKKYTNFKITHSQHKGKPNLLLTPDAAICKDCTQELFESTNRRNNYPFTTCTNCGPRYAIIQTVPYDRGRTTMDTFQMCPHCLKEYGDISNRRYYSQTNSCPACAIKLELFECKEGNAFNISPSFSTLNILEKIITLWQVGKIVAIKGIGGYLLTCDANNEKTVQLLRQRKHRPTKPFAVMFPNVEILEKDFKIEQEEQALLLNSVAPIVLLQQIKVSDSLASAIAPKLNQIGVMLPYTALYQLLLKAYGRPIIATSGNSSNSPIIFKEENAINGLVAIADYILTNNREIVVPQDDSVVKFTYFKQQKIILRRSRGYAPSYIAPKQNFSHQSIVAMGAMLKSTFALAHQDNIFISQYLGDLGNFETQENYKHTLHHFLAIFQSKPELLLVDKHPQYGATIYGKEMATQLGVPTITIQHHEAHFAAVLAENNLLNHPSSILGVIWDGTGLGNDGHIWGGEFFVYQNHQFERRHHLEYVDFILGDKMAKEPRIAALSFCWEIEEARTILKEKFTKTEWAVYNKLLAKGSSLKTSSMGRLFDAVASLLDISDKQSYEGEAALLLESKALQYYQKKGLVTNFSSFDENKDNFKVTTTEILRLLLNDIETGMTKEYIAAHFHFLLIKYIEKIATTQNIHQIAFSGGVFQNGLLIDLLIHHLETTFELYFHKALSPNDENISFGQLMWYEISKRKLNNTT